MSVQNYVVIFLFLFISQIECDNKRDILTRIESINNRSRYLYGVTKKKYDLNDLDISDGLEYPGTNKRKLSELAALWRSYYTCTGRALNRVTSTRQLPSVLLSVYEGTVARLKCAICVAPGEDGLLVWMYAESLANLSFTERVMSDRVLEEDGTLMVFNVQSEDAGVYQCQLGASTGGLVLLEVVGDHEIYTTVKPRSSEGPYPSPVLSLNNGVKVYTMWHPWSECSVCGRVGRQRRYGMCYVQLDGTWLKNRMKAVKMKDGDQIILDNNTIQLFEAFPNGIPCRVRYLPQKIREKAVVRQRANEIMMRMCKTVCKGDVFEVRSPSSSVLESANNSVGVFSLLQAVLRQPVMLRRSTIFADIGQSIAIKCPGTTFQDVPLTWRVNNQLVVPRHLDRVSKGRMYLNARDHLLITAVKYRDANLYSCWQHDKLAGTVKLIVWRGQAYSNHRVVLVILVLVATILLSCLTRGLDNIRRWKQEY